MRILLLCLLGILVYGCGMQPMPVRQSLGFAAPESSLWKLRLQRSGKERFSGVLALQIRDDKLAFQLLDATGITLLTATVTPEEQLAISQIVPQVERTGLPAYLARGLRRIFWESPDQVVETPTGLAREGRYLFLPMWRADYRVLNNNDPIPSSVYLDLWWPQPDMILERLN